MDNLEHLKKQIEKQNKIIIILKKNNSYLINILKNNIIINNNNDYKFNSDILNSAFHLKEFT
jgi:hypothetical protein